MIAVNKPAGFLVQGDATGDPTILDALKDYIKEEYRKPGNVFLAPNHRLDRPVSGVLFFSKTSKALSRTNQLFQKGEIEKKYWAIVEGIPEKLEGELIHYLAKNRKKNISFITKKGKHDSKRSVLTYRTLKVINQKSLIEVSLKTGRPHQIRVQLASLGTPIVGDLKYGASQKLEDQSVALHCIEMSFVHPVKQERITVTAPVPELLVWSVFSD